MMRLLAHGWAQAFLLLMSLAGFFYWAAATGPGLQWLGRSLPILAPGYAVERVEGVLLGRSVWHGLSQETPPK